jgi:hypothetical protein
LRFFYSGAKELKSFALFCFRSFVTRYFLEVAMNEMIAQYNAIVHIRFDGRSWDMPLAALGVNARASDDEILRALAREFDVSLAKLQFYVLDRHTNGNLTLRPEAVFG